MVTLYGLKACDTCRKALKALEASGFAPAFRDVRAEPLSAAELARLRDALGPDMLNSRSTTWRALSEEARAQDPVALLQAHPALMKRPIIDRDGTLTLGWDKTVQAAFGI